MRIAISQLDDKVSETFEASSHLALHVLDFENNASSSEGLHAFPGMEQSLEWLASRDVQVLLTGSMDPDHAMNLGQEGIQVFTGADDIGPAENVQRFLMLVREAMANRSQGCGCGGGHCHSESEEEHECCGGSCHEDGDDHECCGGAGHDDPNHVCKCH